MEGKQSHKSICINHMDEVCDDMDMPVLPVWLIIPPQQRTHPCCPYIHVPLAYTVLRTMYLTRLFSKSTLAIISEIRIPRSDIRCGVL